jgi:hypothetical protein
MNRKRINRNVWVLTLSLCLGVIGYSTLIAQVANPQRAGEMKTPVSKQSSIYSVRQPSIDLGALAPPTATQLKQIKQIPYFKNITTQAPAGRFGAATPPSVDYVVTCGELTIDCGNLSLDPCLKAAKAACGTQ